MDGAMGGPGPDDQTVSDIPGNSPNDRGRIRAAVALLEGVHGVLDHYQEHRPEVYADEDFIDVAVDVIEILIKRMREALHKEREDGQVVQCDHCGDILRPDQIGDHARRRHQ